MKLPMKTAARVSEILSATLFVQVTAMANEQMPSVSAINNSPVATDTRYGFFNGFDHGSS
jgi:hypothetical protein